MSLQASGSTQEVTLCSSVTRAQLCDFLLPETPFLLGLSACVHVSAYTCAKGSRLLSCRKCSSLLNVKAVSNNYF